VSLLAIAIILDPRFKNINFINKVACSQAINKITRFINCTDINLKYQNEQINLDDVNFWSYHEKFINSNISQQNRLSRS